MKPPATSARAGARDASCFWCGARRRCIVFERAGVELALCAVCCFDGGQLVAHSMAASARRPHLKPCYCAPCCDWDAARSSTPRVPGPGAATRIGRIGEELQLDARLQRAADSEGSARGGGASELIAGQDKGPRTF